MTDIIPMIRNKGYTALAVSNQMISRRIQIIFLLFLVSCSLVYSQGGDVNTPGTVCDCQNITVVQADTLIEANLGNDNFVIIDLRTPAELATIGFIENSINIDFRSSDFNTEINSLDKDKTYLIYCASGGRSGQAFDYMGNNGFKKVYNMLYGITAWKNAGFPVVYSTFSPLTFIDSSNFTIYPNPCNNYFNINFKSDVDQKFELELFNSSGLSVIKNSYFNKTSGRQIDVSNLLPGIYFIKVQLSRTSLIKQLVVY